MKEEDKVRSAILGEIVNAWLFSVAGGILIGLILGGRVSVQLHIGLIFGVAFLGTVMLSIGLWVLIQILIGAVTE